MKCFILAQNLLFKLVIQLTLIYLRNWTSISCVAKPLKQNENTTLAEQFDMYLHQNSV